MRADHVLQLNKWVSQNKQQIQLAQKSQKDLVTEAADSLGFKVSVGALRVVLNEHGIVRKTKSERELDAAINEAKKYRELLVKVITATSVPEWLRDELLDENLTEDVKEVIRTRRTA